MKLRFFELFQPMVHREDDLLDIGHPLFEGVNGLVVCLGALNLSGERRFIDLDDEDQSSDEGQEFSGAKSCLAADHAPDDANSEADKACDCALCWADGSTPEGSRSSLLNRPSIEMTIS